METLQLCECWSSVPPQSSVDLRFSTPSVFCRDLRFSTPSVFCRDLRFSTPSVFCRDLRFSTPSVFCRDLRFSTPSVFCRDLRFNTPSVVCRDLRFGIREIQATPAKVKLHGSLTHLTPWCGIQRGYSPFISQHTANDNGVIDIEVVVTDGAP